MHPPRRHRRFLVPSLAIAITLELSLVVLAIGPALAARPQLPEVAAALPAVVGDPGDRAAEHQADRLTIFRGGVPRWLATSAYRPVAAPVAPPVAASVVKSRPTPAASIRNVAVASTVPKAVAPKPVKAKAPTAAAAPAYRGRNHVWIPALGINRSVSFYACSRSTALANVVYRWGCAGTNNVYLMGHAHSVFRALHNAYVNGKLRKGMQVIYADNNGRVTSYRVSYWKVVSPVGAGWAFAAQSRPSMTLQTCVGARSEYRLVVRLVASK